MSVTKIIDKDQVQHDINDARIGQPTTEDVGKSLTVGEDGQLEWAEGGSGGGGTKLYLHTTSGLNFGGPTTPMNWISTSSEPITTYNDLVNGSIMPIGGLFAMQSGNRIATIILGISGYPTQVNLTLLATSSESPYFTGYQHSALATDSITDTVTEL